MFIERQIKAVPFFLTSISVIFTLAPYISTERLLTDCAPETLQEQLAFYPESAWKLPHVILCQAP